MPVRRFAVFVCNQSAYENNCMDAVDRLLIYCQTLRYQILNNNYTYQNSGFAAWVTNRHASSSPFWQGTFLHASSLGHNLKSMRNYNEITLNLNDRHDSPLPEVPSGRQTWQPLSWRAQWATDMTAPFLRCPVGDRHASPLPKVPNGRLTL